MNFAEPARLRCQPFMFNLVLRRCPKLRPWVLGIYAMFGWFVFDWLWLARSGSASPGLTQSITSSAESEPAPQYCGPVFVHLFISQFLAQFQQKSDGVSAWNINRWRRP